jgi:hypothetical protein
MAWDADYTLDELRSADPVVIITVSGSRREAAFQRIRGELRYYLLDSNDPYAEDPADQLGTVESTEAAAALCNEYLTTGAEIGALTTLRRGTMQGPKSV